MSKLALTPLREISHLTDRVAGKYANFTLRQLYKPASIVLRVLSPHVHKDGSMVDTRYCVAGRNRSGAWFIACRVPPKESLRILDELMFTDLTSGPAEQPYDVAARHIQKCGGLFWQTNAVGEYTTIAGIPSVVRDSNS